MHKRTSPKKHSFTYKLFMFWIDLDELDALAKRFQLISYNKFNVFTFRDKNYARFSTADSSITARQRMVEFLSSKGIEAEGKIMLLTHLQTLGYIFNPVSFYVCYDRQGEPLCSIAEVTNTFGEMKQYLLDRDAFENGVFDLRLEKNFYVSPFSEAADFFHFKISVPSDRFVIHVDDYQQEKRVLMSALSGQRKALTNARLLYYALRFPLITIKIMFAIHWQAFKLWVKGVPFFGKGHQIELQKEMVKL